MDALSMKAFRRTLFFKVVNSVTLLSFLVSFVAFDLSIARAQSIVPIPPGQLMGASTAYNMPILRGIQINPQNPFQIDFIVDSANQGTLDKDEASRLIKYFLTVLTIPEKDIWVNLSPYESGKIVSPEFGVTEAGKDLLIQDYLLKQISSSLTYPENELGKKYWDKLRKEAFEKYGTTDIPMNTFNKVWIVPDKATVYEANNKAFVTESTLDVMMEEDYLALSKNTDSEALGTAQMDQADVNQVSNLSSQIMKDMIIPEIRKEVNEGKNFAQLRQIYNSLILALWFKNNLKKNFLNQVYANKSKVKGVNIDDEAMKEKIWQEYVETFKKGVYDYIKEDYDPNTQEIIPRKYFSGGVPLAQGKDGQPLQPKVEKGPEGKGRLARFFAGLGRTAGIFLVGVVLNAIAAVTPAGAGTPVDTNFDALRARVNIEDITALHGTRSPITGRPYPILNPWEVERLENVLSGSVPATTNDRDRIAIAARRKAGLPEVPRVDAQLLAAMGLEVAGASDALPTRGAPEVTPDEASSMFSQSVEAARSQGVSAQRAAAAFYGQPFASSTVAASRATEIAIQIDGALERVRELRRDLNQAGLSPQDAEAMDADLASQEEALTAARSDMLGTRVTLIQIGLAEEGPARTLEGAATDLSGDDVDPRRLDAATEAGFQAVQGPGIPAGVRSAAVYRFNDADDRSALARVYESQGLLAEARAEYRAARDAALEGIGIAASAVGGAVAGTATGAYEWTVDGVVWTGESLAGAGRAAVDGLERARVATGEALDSAIEPALAGAKTAIDVTGGALRTTGLIALGAGATGVEAVYDGAVTAYEAAEAAVATGNEEAIKPALERLSQAVDAMGRAAQAAQEAGVAAASAAGEWTVDGVRWTGESLAGAGRVAVDGLERARVATGEALDSAIEPALAGAKTAIDVTGGALRTTGLIALGAGATGVEAAYDGAVTAYEAAEAAVATGNEEVIKPALERLSQAVDAMGRAAQAAQKAGVAAASATADGVASAGNWTWDRMNEGADAVATGANGAIEGLSAGVNAAGEFVSPAIGTGIDGAEIFFSGAGRVARTSGLIALGAAVEAGEEAVALARAAYAAGDQEALQPALEAIGEAAARVKELAGQAKDAGAELAGEAAQAVGEQLDEFEVKGQETIDRLNGVQDAAEDEAPADRREEQSPSQAFVGGLGLLLKKLLDKRRTRTAALNSKDIEDQINELGGLQAAVEQVSQAGDNRSTVRALKVLRRASERFSKATQKARENLLARISALNNDENPIAQQTRSTIEDLLEATAEGLNMEDFIEDATYAIDQTSAALRQLSLSQRTFERLSPGVGAEIEALSRTLAFAPGVLGELLNDRSVPNANRLRRILNDLAQTMQAINARTGVLPAERRKAMSSINAIAKKAAEQVNEAAYSLSLPIVPPSLQVAVDAVNGIVADGLSPREVREAVAAVREALRDLREQTRYSPELDVQLSPIIAQLAQALRSVQAAYSGTRTTPEGQPIPDGEIFSIAGEVSVRMDELAAQLNLFIPQAQTIFRNALLVQIRTVIDAAQNQKAVLRALAPGINGDIDRASIELQRVEDASDADFAQALATFQERMTVLQERMQEARRVAQQVLGEIGTDGRGDLRGILGIVESLERAVEELDGTGILTDLDEIVGSIEGALNPPPVDEQAVRALAEATALKAQAQQALREALEEGSRAFAALDEALGEDSEENFTDQATFADILTNGFLARIFTLFVVPARTGQGVNLLALSGLPDADINSFYNRLTDAQARLTDVLDRTPTDLIAVRQALDDLVPLVMQAISLMETVQSSVDKLPASLFGPVITGEAIEAEAPAAAPEAAPSSGRIAEQQRLRGISPQDAARMAETEFEAWRFAQADVAGGADAFVETSGQEGLRMLNVAEALIIRGELARAQNLIESVTMLRYRVPNAEGEARERNDELDRQVQARLDEVRAQLEAASLALPQAAEPAPTSASNEPVFEDVPIAIPNSIQNPTQRTALSQLQGALAEIRNTSSEDLQDQQRTIDRLNELDLGIALARNLWTTLSDEQRQDLGQDLNEVSRLVRIVMGEMSGTISIQSWFELGSAVGDLYQTVQRIEIAAPAIEAPARDEQRDQVVAALYAIRSQLGNDRFRLRFLREGNEVFSSVLNAAQQLIDTGTVDARAVTALQTLRNAIGNPNPNVELIIAAARDLAGILSEIPVPTQPVAVPSQPQASQPSPEGESSLPFPGGSSAPAPATPAPAPAAPATPAAALSPQLDSMVAGLDNVMARLQSNPRRQIVPLTRQDAQAILTDTQRALDGVLSFVRAEVTVRGSIIDDASTERITAAVEAALQITAPYFEESDAGIDVGILNAAIDQLVIRLQGVRQAVLEAKAPVGGIALDGTSDALNVQSGGGMDQLNIPMPAGFDPNKFQGFNFDFIRFAPVLNPVEFLGQMYDVDATTAGLYEGDSASPINKEENPNAADAIAATPTTKS